MRFHEMLVAALGCGLVTGCQLLVTFEDVPEGTGGGAATTTGGASTGDTGGAATGGTSTGGTATCTAACCSAEDCPAPADPCKLPACASGACGEQPVPEGGDAQVQITGDCKKVVCQGGVATQIDDPSDLLDDASECTVETCSGGDPKSTLNQGNPCLLAGAGAGVCDGNGKCVECLSNAHCPPEEPHCDSESRVCVPQSCDNNTLDGAETGNDCGGPLCGACKSGQTCAAGTDCQDGVCDATGHCLNPTCTDGVKNGNESDVDCGDACPVECAAGQGCHKGGDCQSNQCTGQGGVCLATCQDGLKNNLESDVDCGGPGCKACGAGLACGGFGGNCLSGDCGPAGTCEQGQNSAPCGQDTDCLSGHCTDGVCCDDNCGGACKSCALPGSAGTCTNVPAGQQDGCPFGYTCNANGNCTQ